MDDQTAQLTRNTPHIQRVKDIQLQLQKVQEVTRGSKKVDKLIPSIQSILSTVQGGYNNREMALVATKLQEAIFNANRNQTQYVLAKLQEAEDWAGAYIEVLQ